MTWPSSGFSAAEDPCGCAQHSLESLVLEIARPRDHARLARALDGEVFQGADPSLRSWIRRTTRELIIAPLRG